MSQTGGRGILFCDSMDEYLTDEPSVQKEPSKSPYLIPYKDPWLIKWEESYAEELDQIKRYLGRYFSPSGINQLIEKIMGARLTKSVSLSSYDHNQIAEAMINFETDLAQQIAIHIEEWDYDMTDFRDIVNTVGDLVFSVYQRALGGGGRRSHHAIYSFSSNETQKPEKEKGFLSR